jgi:hypothetical protein
MLVWLAAVAGDEAMMLQLGLASVGVWAARRSDSECMPQLQNAPMHCRQCV